jgi:hypothetical protein
MHTTTQAYLTTFLPSGTYTVNDTLNLVQPGKMFLTTVGTPYCNNMAEVWGAKNRTQIEHCGRTAPAEVQGSRKGARAVIVLAKGTGLHGPVRFPMSFAKSAANVKDNNSKTPT